MNSKVKQLLLACAAGLAVAVSSCASGPAANGDVTQPATEQREATTVMLATPAADTPPTADPKQASAAPANCYDYLTEMVRSSNFPFCSLDRKKMNLVIDEDADGIVSAQVVFETEGTGITGWVRYESATQTLFNTSAQLETPERLRFDKKWAELFARCRTGDVRNGKASSGAVNSSNQPADSSTRNQRSSLADAVRRSQLQSLPLAYDYDYVMDAPQFVPIADADLALLTGQKLSDGRVRRLPSAGTIQPILVAGAEPSGERPMFLVTLDATGQAVSRIILYRFEEGDGGGGMSTTFKIAPDYTTTTTRQAMTRAGAAGRGKSKTYRLTAGGKFVEVR